MARHAAAPEGAATVKVTIRVTPTAVAGWRAAAAREGLSLSDWVRAQIAAAATGAATPAATTGAAGGGALVMPLVGRRPPRKRDGLGVAVAPPVDPAVVMALARIGNNLNQLARARNAAGQPADAVLLVVLAGIEAQLRIVLRGGLPAQGG